MNDTALVQILKGTKNIFRHALEQRYRHGAGKRTIYVENTEAHRLQYETNVVPIWTL